MPLPTLTQTEYYAAHIEAMAASTAAQNARAAAEQAVASMGSKQADAQIAAAVAFSKPLPPPTDAELLLRFMQTRIGAGAASAAAAAGAKTDLTAFKALTYKPPAAPT